MEGRRIYSEEEFKKMIYDLYGTIGVRMEIADNGPLDRIDQGNFLAVCKIMLDYLELSVTLQPRFTSQFETRALAKNETGSTHGVAAQVAFPHDSTLPWYRSDRMKGYPIAITIDPAALGNPYVVLTQLSHEFSHIYLYSRRDPLRESEHATDLCAMMMGFTPFWAKGRKTSTLSHTLTQGYLSDEEYGVAVRTIRDLRMEFKQLRDEAKKRLSDIQYVKSQIDAHLEELAQAVDFHYRHPQGVLKDPSDAKVFAELAQPYFRAGKKELVARLLEQTNGIARSLNRKRDFFEADKAWLNDVIAQLKTVCKELQQADAEVTHRIKVVSRNIDAKYDAQFQKSAAAIRAGMKAVRALCDMIRAHSEYAELALDVYEEYAKKAAPNPGEQQKIHCVGETEVSDTLAQTEDLLGKIGNELDGRKFFSITEQQLTELRQSTEYRKALLERLADRQTTMLAAVRRNITFAGRILLFWRNITRNNRSIV